MIGVTSCQSSTASNSMTVFRQQILHSCAKVAAKYNHTSYAVAVHHCLGNQPKKNSLISSVMSLLQGEYDGFKDAQNCKSQVETNQTRHNFGTKLQSGRLDLLGTLPESGQKVRQTDENLLTQLPCPGALWLDSMVPAYKPC